MNWITKLKLQIEEVCAENEIVEYFEDEDFLYFVVE